MKIVPSVLNTGQISQGSGFWIKSLRRYLLFVLAANLVWETLHLPLYTIWFEDSPRAIAFAVVHCTGGDLLIALSSVMLALILVGNGGWPLTRFGPVALLTVLFGVTYTVFSEWLNIVVRKSWAYSEYMPVIPVIDAGLSPVAQWIVIPTVGLWWARRTVMMRAAWP